MRKPKGTVAVSSVRGMLRIQIPRHLFGGQQKYLYLNLPDTALNRAAAEQKAMSIAADIAFERFDFTLNKYQTQVQAIDEFPLTLRELWEKYTAYKSGHLAITTINKDFKRVAAHIASLPSQALRDARKIRRHLINTLTSGAAKKTLMQIRACCQWATDEELIPRNPFAHIPGIRAPKPKVDINPFTRHERDLIITTFEEHPVWKHHAPFVKFLFWTGCRPSEAIGLQWKHISSDLTEITFSEAVVEGKRKDTKTHTIRKFPCNANLKNLLVEVKPIGVKPDCLVFLGPKGSAIDGHNFLNRAWKGVLEELAIAYRTVYNTRHSFISLCLDSGIQVAQVARWVGNSPQTIWKHYAGLVSTSEVPE
ncbi:tyrosine-type recombinase/integrase [Kamptonema sp. UHCC 0994]|uniref:tyrosine-type recombinase/integrase n=1 Tax=Kamptonema sp. UHCC 0994 TaxID=3031329 RepID=UPI0023B9F2ED|nr:tyrosine-type recombinase/integrase [Kamptonema sp. UHCC 0994]MDF0553177.1 tyrosine-type recombinase/integrase [Kamptonema sp. UHCC 0994]